MTSAKEIEEQAAHWLLRQEEDGWSAEDQAAFDSWIEASTLHRVAFYRLEHGWRRADRLAASKRAASPTYRLRFSFLRIGSVAAAAAVLAVAIAAGTFTLRHAPDVASRTFRTELGGRSSYPLDDGSQVELNTDSQLRTELSAKSRAAWLDKGEAYFQIAHDPDRPFVIHAGKQLVTVLGTKFSVRLDGDRVTVAVMEGRVQVGAKPSLAIATPGDVVLAQGEDRLVQHGPVDQVAAALSWRQGMLTFDRATLADVAREFNRYNRKKLSVDPATAAAIHVGGTFDAENVDAFVRLMKQAYRLTVEDDGTTVKISGGQKPSH
jgi:transmembrane sensor